MAWSGKVLGGLFGGMVGGPVGMGVGAALGHFLADGDGARAARTLPLELRTLTWQHHVFRGAGPGMVLAPEWVARDLRGRDVRVRMEVGGDIHEARVELEADPEVCVLPRVFVPYAGLRGSEISVSVRLQADAAEDRATFAMELPGEIRRLGNSGPARVVMALVACARAGDRSLVRDDVRFIRARFGDAHPLDADGRAWLTAWVRVLADTGLERISAERVARRIERHLDELGVSAVLTWLMHGARASWTGEAQEAWIEQFAAALGYQDTGPLWASVDADPDEWTRVRAAGVLGVTPGSDPDVVREAWLRLVQTHHPDRARTAEDADVATHRTAEINAAYAVLRK